MVQALKDNGGGQLVSIDPFQSTQWDNTARLNLARAELSSLSVVMEEPSYLAMPALLRQGRGQDFDFVFVDGMHMFDYTLVDLFYADLLVRVGGVILLDDIRHPGVAAVFSYIRKNYLHWQYIENTGCSTTLGTFVKVAADTRSWDFHAPF